MRARSLLLGLLAALGAAALACGEPEGVNLDVDPSGCSACHLGDYKHAHKHVGVKPTTCGTCHAQDGWHPTRLDHSWPLDGAHEKADCFKCHAGTPAKFAGTPKACAECHEKERVKANAELSWHDHLGAACEKCHSTTAWKPELPDAPWIPPPTPSAHPSATATAKPTATPTVTVTVTATAKPPPTAKPTATPTIKPTAPPTTARPTSTPTTSPTLVPTAPPTTTKPDIITSPSRRR